MSQSQSLKDHKVGDIITAKNGKQMIVVERRKSSGEKFKSLRFLNCKGSPRENCTPESCTWVNAVKIKPYCRGRPVTQSLFQEIQLPRYHPRPAVIAPIMPKLDLMAPQGVQSVEHIAEVESIPVRVLPKTIRPSSSWFGWY